MKPIAEFSRFARNTNVAKRSVEIKNAVVYTRVSGKEQFDNNLSLETQLKAIQEYASRNDILIADYFGGTYESAKTDGRKEFQRMLGFIKRNKGITHILVYILDRFSRTGGAAIELARDLRENYGVDIIAVTQPADTSNPGGVLQQSIQFVFSNYDNALRRQRTIAGMKETFERGIWAAPAPFGYDIVKSGGVRKIVVNAIGKKLKNAFIWKAQGIKNEAILERLKGLGLSIAKQKLSYILQNPFYCGLIAHGLLEGKVVNGTHEILISQEIFLKANEISEQHPQFGVPHKKEQEEIPLKIFMKCSDCGGPFTGYVVKSKKLWYYKCRTKGCRCNKSAKQINRAFIELLNNYAIQPTLIEPFSKVIAGIWKNLNKGNEELIVEYKKQISEVEKKIENIEEAHFVTRQMSKDMYEKYRIKLHEEHMSISKLIKDYSPTISNPEKTIKKALTLASNLATGWVSSEIEEKEKLQRIVFPEGILYDREIDTFRTPKVNGFFELTKALSIKYALNKNETNQVNTDLSHPVSPIGLEPMAR